VSDVGKDGSPATPEPSSLNDPLQADPTNDPPSEVSAGREYPGDEPRPFRRLPRPSFVSRSVPLLGDLRTYKWQFGQRDALAGVAIAALAVPQAMAYAQTAGMPVEAGLYGLLLPVAAYAFFGSARRLMTGPTATAALLVAPAVIPLAHDDAAKYVLLAGMFAIITGVVLIIASIARLGWIADYFSYAVLLGFLTGLAFTLLAGQLGAVTGVSVPSGTPFEQYVHFFSEFIGSVSGIAVATSAVTLVALLVGGRWLPKFPMLLVVTVLSIVVSWAFDLGSHGLTLVGEIPAGLPSLSIPHVSLTEFLQLIPPAVGLALVAYADAILIGRSMGSGESKPVDANQELAALGAMNVAAGVSQSFPLGASGSRTAVNVRLGGRTQVVSLFQVASVVVVLLFLTGALAYLPKATLGAIIVYAAIGLINVAGWRSLWRGSRGEVVIAAATVFTMLVAGLMAALAVAVVLSVFDVVRRSAQPRDAILGWSERAGRFVDVQNHPRARVFPGVIIYRLDDRLFFANSQYFHDRVLEAVQGAKHEVHTVIFDAEGVTHIDASGAQALRGIIGELSDNDIRFVVGRLKQPLEERLAALGLDDVLGPDDLFPTVHAAVLAMAGVDVLSSTER
jgi:sulfate permease, SulP family